ncbi:MAG TPA: TonB-dependent receptor [Lacunisphaera sp.]|nr:TonB-dependent receptor [Lacunisphaera sp.]
MGAADAGATPSVKALKSMSLEELMDIEVTSVSKRPEKLAEAAAAIQVITQDDIRHAGAASLPEALRLAGNLDVAQKNPHDWGISARGFNTALANKLLVMIDGRSVYTPLFSGVFWDAQDYLLEDIDRIEVISGPGGTLWGANAVNGVINVITKSARDTQGVYSEAGVGTELRDFAAVRYGMALAPAVHLRVYGKMSDMGKGSFANDTAAPDAWTSRRAGFRLDADLPGDATGTVQGDIYHSAEYVVTGGIQRIGGGNLLGRWTRELSSGSSMSLQLYFDRTHLVDPITNRFGASQNLTDDLDTYDVDFQHRFPLGARQSLLWGSGYRLTHDVVHNAPNTAFLPARADHQLFSVFVQDEVTLNARLLLTLGTKVEHNDYTGMEGEPSARLRWSLAPDQTLWTAVSRAVRMPARYDRDIFQPNPPPVVAHGDKEFRSETVVAYEAGYRAQLSPKVSGTVSVFYNDYDHLRSFGPTAGAPGQAGFGNNLAGETRGLEFTVQHQVSDGWRLRGSYDLLREHLHVKPGQVDLFGGRNEASDPRQQAALGSSWDLSSQLDLDANLRWVDTRPTTSGVVPSYGELDVRLAWRPNNQLEFSVVGQNLLHAHHPEFGIAVPRREEIQRNIYGKVTCRF